MAVFPMLRVKRTNEHMMSDVFKVLLLYHIPFWIENPMGILRLILLVGVAALIDCVFSLIRYKKIWCCVSGAVTAAMISLLTSGAPLWGQILGVAVALILGKQVWGGTGKNLLNPAMVGLVPILLLFDLSFPFFPNSLLFLPAILLSLLFLRVRPFAGLGFIVGMVAGLYINQDLSWMNIISYGVFFWGCLVITDPVTVTRNKVAGIAAGFLAGFGALVFSALPIAVVLCLLLVNLFSTVVETITDKNYDDHKAKLKIPKAVAAKNYQKKLIDLTNDNNQMPERPEISKLSAAVLLERIQKNEVFGMGGAAFPTHRKMMTVLASQEAEKHLILNGVECDPGLIHDAWLLRNYKKELQQGIAILSECIDFQSITLAVKDKDGLDFGKNIRVQQVEDSYPIGAEKILIKELLDKKLTTDQIPATCGILVLNVQTVYSIYQAVYQNKMINTRYITVADLKLKTAQVVKVKLGSKLHEVMEEVYPGTFNVFAGGGIMQAYLAEEDAVVDQSVNFIATGNYPTYKESPQCSKCGNCSKNCPSGLKVNLIADLVDQGKQEKTEKYHVSECISCGSCSYSCLAGRNLAAKVKMAKESLTKGMIS